MNLSDTLFIDSSVIVAVITFIGVYLKQKLETQHDTQIQQFTLALERISLLEERWEECVEKLTKR
ncbi:MAG: hypothetical protein LBC39_02690 [Methanobrevibacter sp.]|jgi:hypothetical protein|nr:hypothetical protein [Candidatus Methanovirga aequatorialis]